MEIDEVGGIFALALPIILILIPLNIQGMFQTNKYNIQLISFFK